MADSIKPILYIGQNFDCREDFETCLRQYENEKKQVYTTRTSTRLKAEHINENSRNEHYELIYECKFAREYAAKTTEKRKSRTFRRKCPAVIRLLASTDKSCLIIKKLQDCHENHDGSEQHYEYLPQVRKLNEEQSKFVDELLDMNCPIKEIQRKVEEKFKNYLSRKDLHNRRAKLRNDDDDTLEAAVKLLAETYDASVTIIQNQNQFQGLFFSTHQMRQDVADFPEILFVDGTYKLFQRNFTLMLLVVENNHGETLGGGVGILANEKQNTLKKFFECFKNNNMKSVDNIRCFMTDKDLTERSVISEIFPGKFLYLCQFHVLKALSRAVAINKMPINSEEKMICLTYMERRVKSQSEKEYDEIYKQFIEVAPKDVSEYFNYNWHSSRSEWSKYNMINGNLGNLTNNRLESMNGKLKKDIPLNNSLVDFINGFFLKFLRPRTREFERKRIHEQQKKNVMQYSKDSDEAKFELAMTTYGFTHIIEEIQKSKTITFLTWDDKSMLCTIAYRKGIIQVLPDQCSCFEMTSLLLPACRHIFAVRRRYRLPLFDETHKSNRWMERGADSQPIDRFVASEECEDATSLDVEYDHTTGPSKEEKRLQLSSVLDKILDIGTSTCSEDSYVRLLGDLKKMITSYGDNVNVSHVHISLDNEEVQEQPVNNIKIIEANMANLSIDLDKQSASQAIREENPLWLQNENIAKIELPPKIKIKGRSKKAASCTIKLPKKKNRPTPFQSKAPEEQAKQILGLFLDEKILDLVTNMEYKITIQDLPLDIANVLNYIAYPEINFTVIEQYLGKQIFAHMVSEIEKQKLSPQSQCTVCDKAMSGITQRLWCSSCLHWYHLSCAGRQRVPSAWFCPNCR